MGGGWRVKELAATVKYMSPVANESSFWEKAAGDWQSIEPLIDGASKLAATAQPLAGAAAGASAKLFAAMAQLKLSSVPSVKGFEWSATKVAFGNREHGGVAQGVAWMLPPSMFRELGGRLHRQPRRELHPRPQAAARPCERCRPRFPRPQDLLAHAVVYSPDGHEHDHWAPGKQRFVHLRIEPVVLGRWDQLDTRVTLLATPDTNRLASPRRSPVALPLTTADRLSDLPRRTHRGQTGLAVCRSRRRRCIDRRLRQQQ